MKRDDRQLLADLAQVNTALPEFAMRVMDHTATLIEHHAVAERLITLGQAIGERAGRLTVINAQAGEGECSKTMATVRALSALVDMADAVDRTRGVAPGCAEYDSAL